MVEKHMKAAEAVAQGVGGLGLGAALPQKSSKVTKNAAAGKPTDLELLSANELRELGNSCFREGKMKEAFELYSKCIEKSDEKDFAAFSNRAEIRLKLGQFGWALTDADKALELNPEHTRSKFRKGTALMGMRRFAEAVVVYEDILKENPEEKLSAESLKFAKLRAAQAAGNIDAREIYFTQRAVEAAQKGAEVCADFISDALVIGNINGQKGGGRGLFCKRPVKKGELLMVTNASALARTGKPPAKQMQWLVHNLSQVAYLDIRELERVYTLSCGDEASNLSSPEVEIFHPSAPVPESGSLTIEKDRLEKICECNAFGSSVFSDRGSSKQRVESKDGDGGEYVGLWVLPAFMNHSCVPSATRLLVGTTMFVRATRDLEAGEEITHKYFDVCQPLAMRRLQAKKWGFSCSCKRCLSEASRGADVMRALANLEAKTQEARTAISKVVADQRLSEQGALPVNEFMEEHKRFENLLDRLDKPTPLDEKERAWLVNSALSFYMCLALMLALNGDMEKRLELNAQVCKALEETDGSNFDHCKMAMVQLHSAKKLYGRKSPQVEAAQAYCEEVHSVRYGAMKPKDMEELLRHTDNAQRNQHTLDFCSLGGVPTIS